MSQNTIMVTLRSSDNEEFKVDQSVASESQMLKDIIEGTGVENVIPVYEVPAKLLAITLEYCEYHAGLQKKQIVGQIVSEDEIKNWDAEFIKRHDLFTLYSSLSSLVRAANYLNINRLLELTTQVCTDNLKNRTPEQIREFFGIENDFGPGEEAQIRQENQWAFD